MEVICKELYSENWKYTYEKCEIHSGHCHFTEAVCRQCMLLKKVNKSLDEMFSIEFHIRCCEHAGQIDVL